MHLRWAITRLGHMSEPSQIFEREPIEPSCVLTQCLDLSYPRLILSILPLQIGPETCANAQDTFELDRGVGCDRSLPADDLVDRLKWPTHAVGQFSLGDFALGEKFFESLSRWHGVEWPKFQVAISHGSQLLPMPLSI